MNDVEGAKFQIVCVNDNPTVEDLTKQNNFLYDIQIVDGALVGEIAKKEA